MIDRLRVINLDRTPERMARFRERHPEVPIERVPAVDGRTLNREACIDARLVTPDNVYSPAAIGCALSHVGLWRACAAGDVPFHIAEDDVILRRDFPLMVGVMLETLDAWDIVLWSHNLDWPMQAIPAEGLGIALLKYGERAVDPQVFRMGRAQPLLLRLFSAAGTGCYSVSPAGAQALLERCLPLGCEPASYVHADGRRWTNTGIDAEMSRHYGALSAYVSVPILALAENDHATSTVQRPLST